MLSGDMLHDGGFSAAEKACAARNALGITNGLLIDTLGKQGKAVLVKETESEWELLIPHCLLPHLKFEEKVIAKWRRHKFMPVSAKWCDVASGLTWMEWHEGLQPDCIPDVSQGLLPEAEEDASEHSDVVSSPCETQVPGLWLMASFLTIQQETALLESIDEFKWKMNRAKSRRVQMYGVQHDDQYRVYANAPVRPLPDCVDPLVQKIQALIYEKFPGHVTYRSKLGIPKV